MSRSAEPAARREPRPGRGLLITRTTGGLALVLAAALSAPTGAAASRSDDPSPSPAYGVMPVVAPVMPVVAMVMPTKDLAGIAVVEERDRKIDVRLDANVLFPKDSDVVRPSAGARLKEVALILRARGAGRIGIDGYTDDLGTAAHGVDLSRRRANAIATRLRPFLPAGQFPFVVRGLGESNFVAPNTSEANRRKNRRVEIHFTTS
jgi:outer membrane protein OmpA-like peptidoglycan-associated protein